MNHKCFKEQEIAELKKAIDKQEKHSIRNYTDIRTQQAKYEELMIQRKAMFKEIREIKDCQNNLINEIVKISTSFKTIKYLIGIFLGLFGGIFVFLITELIKII